MIVSVVEKPKFIMKASLKWAPVLGQYGLRIGCVPVERGKRRSNQIYVAKVKKVERRPLVAPIYPQGTRVAPGDHVPYKVGTAVYIARHSKKLFPQQQMWVCSGLSEFTAKGTAVVEFLDPIEQGLDKDALWIGWNM